MIVALIPARGGSKRVPRKNLQKIGRRTLLEWSIIEALHCPAIDHVYVSSEDDEILGYAREYKKVSALKRSAEAATDDATDRDVVLDFLSKTSGDVSLIVYLRPTTPFRMGKDIEEAIQKMIDVPEATGLRSVHEMSESAYKCFEVGIGRILRTAFTAALSVDSANLPNHFYPKTYHPNGVVDIIRPEVVRTGALFGDRVMAHITKPTIEIDTLHDFKLAEFELAIRSKEGREVFRP